MRIPYTLLFFFALCLLGSCVFVVGGNSDKSTLANSDSLQAHAQFADSLPKQPVALPADTLRPDSAVKKLLAGTPIDTRNVQPADVVKYARTLIGVPYRYGSIDPAVGFDCSGFITYVFRHFEIIVPRSSIDFTAVGTTVEASAAKPGDLVLFTGTDSTEKFVGHMGLIVQNDGTSIEFIHSTSGKQHGVTITPLSDYYKSRYIKTIRIF